MYQAATAPIRPKEYVDAYELAHALATLGTQGPDVTVLAGGTDVMVQYLRGLVSPSILLNIRRLPELTGVSTDDRTLIGAVTTHRQLTVDPIVRNRHAALAEAAATVGGRQTQNMGTIAGNLVNASPAADLLPVLLVSDATVILRSATTSRELGVGEFVVGRRATLRTHDELVTKLSLEPTGPRSGETYLKIGRRGAMEVAVVGLAVRIAFALDGAVTDARIAACSVAPVAFRACEAERRLIGSKLDDETLREAGELLRHAASPIDDARATASYRRAVLVPMLRRAVFVCRKRSSTRS